MPDRKANQKVKRTLVIAAIGAIVFFTHFRFWDHWLVEEWTNANPFKTQGWGWYVNSMPQFAARPFHLVPTLVGFTISPNAQWGLFLVLGLVVLAQALVIPWALRPIVESWSARWLLALVIGLHPWWVGGFLLRFLAAQVSVLALLVALGFLVRFINDGKVTRLIAACLSVLYGMLTYEALLLAAGLVAVLLAYACWQRSGSLRRAIVGVAAFLGTLSIYLAYSLIIVPRAFPDSYETAIRAQSIGLQQVIIGMIKSLIKYAPVLIVFAAIVLILLLHWSFTRTTERTSWILLIGFGLSWAAALTYVANSSLMLDSSRTSFPIGTALFGVLCAGLALAQPPVLATGSHVAVVPPATVPHRRVFVSAGLFAAVAALMVACSVFQMLPYVKDGRLQTELLTQMEPMVADLPSGSNVVVADYTGLYGYTYTFYPTVLSSALWVDYGISVNATICNPPGVAHPADPKDGSPALPSCTTALQPDAQKLGSAHLPEGVVDIYVNP